MDKRERQLLAAARGLIDRNAPYFDGEKCKWCGRVAEMPCKKSCAFQRLLNLLKRYTEDGF
jgi:hypothetical protein